MNIFKGQNIVSIGAFFALLIYAYNSIVYVGYLEGNSSWVAYSVVLFDFLAFYSLLANTARINSKSVTYALSWVVWMFVLFFIFLRGGRTVLIFNALFAPLGYTMFFKSSYYSKDNYNLSRLLGIGLFEFCLLYVIFVLRNGVTYILGESTAASNLSYWPLCLFPFVFLVEKKIVRITMIVLMVIVGLLTVKRGAAIILFIVLFAYIHINYFSRGKRNPIRLIIVGLLLLMAYYGMEHFLGYYLDSLSERMTGIATDKGSGRDIIYSKTIDAIGNSSVVDWIIGHGCYSFPQTGYSNAHNDFLQMMYEYGLVGVCFYLIMIFERVSKIRVYRKKDTSTYMAYFTSVVILIVMGLVSNIVPSLSYFVFITSLWGLLDGRLKRESCYN